jgi:hypothetical protein
VRAPLTSYLLADEIPHGGEDGRRERFERQKLIAGLLKARESGRQSVAASKPSPIASR